MRKYILALLVVLSAPVLFAKTITQSSAQKIVQDILLRYEIDQHQLKLKSYLSRKGSGLRAEEIEKKAQANLLNNLRNSGLNPKTQRLVFELIVASKSNKINLTDGIKVFKKRVTRINDELFEQRLSHKLMTFQEKDLKGIPLISIPSWKIDNLQVCKLPKKEMQNVLEKSGFSQEVAEKISQITDEVKKKSGINDIDKVTITVTLQDVVNKNFEGKKAAVLNNAIKEYLENPDSSARSAAYAALEKTMGQYVADEHARKILLTEIGNARDGKKVNTDAAAKALAEGGLKLYIDHTHLSENEKNLAKAAVSEVLGQGGEIPAATAILLKEKLLKNGFSEERASIISQNVQTYMENPKNVNALSLAAATSVQELVTLHLNDKPAAVINDAINKYLTSGDISDASFQALESVVAQYVPDSELKAVLIESVCNAKDGKKVDLEKVSSVACSSGLKNLINDSNLSDTEKKLVSGVIDEFVGGKDGSLLNVTGEVLKDKLIAKGIDPEKAAGLSGFMQDFLAGKGNVNSAKAVAADSIQILLNQWMSDKEAAKTVGDAIAQALKSGNFDDAAYTGLENILKQHVKDPKLQSEIIKMIKDAQDGKPLDVSGAAAAIPIAAINKLIDNSNLTEKQKQAAKAILDEFGADADFLSTPAAREALAGVLQEAGLSPEDAEKLANQIGNFVAGKEGSLDDLLETAEVIFSSELKEAIQTQMNELFAKLPPGLQKLLDACGLTPEFIADFLSNMDNLKLLFDGIVNGSLKAWKELADKLFDHVWSSICAFAEKALLELLNLVLDKVTELASRIDALQKYMGLIQKARVVVTDLGTAVIKEGVKNVKNYGESLWNSIKVKPSSPTAPSDQNKRKVVPVSDIGKRKLYSPGN